MRLACTFNVHHENPVIIASFRKKGYWLIKMWTTNGIEKIEKEVRNKTKVHLMELHAEVYKEFQEMIAELSPITDGGFSIYRVK